MVCYFLPAILDLMSLEISDVLRTTPQCCNVWRIFGDMSDELAAWRADSLSFFMARIHLPARAKRNLLFGPAVFSQRDICLVSSGDRRPL